jgi:hypothetical protein
LRKQVRERVLLPSAKKGLCTPEEDAKLAVTLGDVNPAGMAADYKGRTASCVEMFALLVCPVSILYLFI